MGAGASAAEGRIFCHHCGARTAVVTGSENPVCGACGAIDGVESTDARLPVTSSSSTAAAALSTSGAAGMVGAAIGATSGIPSTAGTSMATASTPAAMRVESVTVVAVDCPEEGGLLLRVLPNVVARREVAPGNSPTSAPEPSSGVEAEEGDVPLEPACASLISHLESEPLARETPGYGVLCVICADEITEVKTPVVTLGCSHIFHEACIHQWLTRRHTCPTCRLELEVDDAKFLRSIGRAEEADALEKAEQERQAKELQKQATARRRWVESMRRGDPVHFGLTCGKCAITPLTGDCYRCVLCEGYVLCSECFAMREARLTNNPPATNDSEDVTEGSEEEHPSGHLFVPFGNDVTGANGSRVPPGPGGLLTVLVPAPARAANLEHSTPETEGPGEAALAAAEVAFAAVRSLALAPLAGSSSPAANGGGPGGNGGSNRWPSARQRGR